MYIDTHLAAKAIRNYYVHFMQLQSLQTRPGDTAYVNLLEQLSAALEREYPGEGGDAVSACGSSITSTFVDMIVLAYPRLFIPPNKVKTTAIARVD
jgi:hypothetical protein